jgi:hypothetical protein
MTGLTPIPSARGAKYDVMFVTLTLDQLWDALIAAETEWLGRCNEADHCQDLQNEALDAYTAAIRARDLTAAATAKPLVAEYRAAARSAYAGAIEQGNMIAAINRAIRARQATA